MVGHDAASGCRNQCHLVLAVVIGQRRGRWSEELAGSAEAWRSGASILGQRLGQHPVEFGGIVVGHVVFEGWRFITGTASCRETLLLSQASLTHHGHRHGQRFLEHKALAAATLKRVSSQQTCPCTFSATQSALTLALVGLLRASCAMSQQRAWPALCRQGCLLGSFAEGRAAWCFMLQPTSSLLCELVST